MIAIRSTFAAVVAFALLSTTSLLAQGLDLVGNVSWDKFDQRILIQSERIQNNDASGTSGFLRLQIRATTEAYDGNDINGWVIGTVNLGRLDAGFSFVNISRVTRYFKPPPGIYFTTITLEEEDVNGDFFIMDYENFAEPVNLGGYGAGFVNVEEAGDGDITFAGDVGWKSGNGRVEFFAQEIFNPRSFGRSGVLRLRLWATSEPYNGGILQGFPMATKRVGRLNANSSFVDFYGQTFFRSPPPDDYYFVTMALEEFVRGRWEIVDYVTYPDANLF